MHIKEVVFESKGQKTFPYNLPFFHGKPIAFSEGITILIGENGAGKSTFIELLNEVLDLPRIVGKKEVSAQEDLFKNVRNDVKIHRLHQKPKGFFFGAEDFTGYIHYLVKEKNASKEELKRIERDYKNRSDYAKGLASMPHQRTIHEIDQLHNRDLLSSSHGEAYLSFFSSRMKENSLYLLDEPETPLSIQNQLSLLYLIDEAVKKGCQFVIASHSPVIMAIPGAKILWIGDDEIKEISYEEIESVALLKQFLNQKEQFFKHLFQ
jgi:predicted ATPase